MKLFIILLPLLAYGNFAPQSEVESCIIKSANKLIVPADASITVSKTCMPNITCAEIPPNFSCIYFGFVAKTQVTECTVVPPAPPENPSGTEPLPPVVPQCEFVTCPPGQIRTATDTAVTCSWQALELDPAKQATYDAQKAQAETTQAAYQESQLYNNLQDYCLYTTGLACPAMPPATQSAMASSFSGFTGKSITEIKKLMNKKIGKKK